MTRRSASQGALNNNHVSYGNASSHMLVSQPSIRPLRGISETSILLPSPGPSREHAEDHYRDGRHRRIHDSTGIIYFYEASVAALRFGAQQAPCFDIHPSLTRPMQGTL